MGLRPIYIFNYFNEGIDSTSRVDLTSKVGTRTKMVHNESAIASTATFSEHFIDTSCTIVGNAVLKSEMILEI